MPYRWVAGGCSRTSDDGVSMHKFPTDASLVSKWSKAIRVHRADWTGPSPSSRLCSLHFTSDCYDRETIIRKKMRLEDKRLNLKEGSIPTLFPSKKDIDAGSETWWNCSIHCMETSSEGVDTSSGRLAFRKRQRSQVLIKHKLTCLELLLIYTTIINCVLYYVLIRFWMKFFN